MNGRFDRLFLLAVDKEAKVTDMGEWEEGVWRWRWNWRRSLFLWEETLVNDLQRSLGCINISANGMDSWNWKHDHSGFYTIKSACKVLTSEIVATKDMFYTSLWNRRVPTKVAGFAWKLSMERIPSVVNLARRNIICSSNVSCHGCKLKDEITFHIFFL